MAGTKIAFFLLNLQIRQIQCQVGSVTCNSGRKAHKRLQLPWWKYGYDTSPALSRMLKPPRVGWTCSGLISSPPERMCTLKWQAWANHDDEGGESFSLMGAERVQGNASGKQTHTEIHLKKKKKCTVTYEMWWGNITVRGATALQESKTRLLTFLPFFFFFFFCPEGLILWPGERHAFNRPRLLFRRLFTDVCVSVKEASLSVRLTPAYSVCRPQATSCPDASSEWPSVHTSHIWWHTHIYTSVYCMTMCVLHIQYMLVVHISHCTLLILHTSPECIQKTLTFLMVTFTEMTTMKWVRFFPPSL